MKYLVNSIDVKIRKIEHKNSLLIIGSDGLWEFLNGKNIAKELKSVLLKKDLDSVCDKLLEKAKLKWTKNEEMVDDITFITVFLEGKNPSNSLVM